MENKAATNPLREHHIYQASLLLRYYGFDLKGADAILSERRTGKLRDVTYLRKLGIVVAHVAPFILMDSKRAEMQMAMF